MLAHLRSAARGIRSALTGWLAALLMTLPFQLVELGQNAPPAGALLNIAEGVALWAGFTGAVCVTAALVIAAPAAVVFTPAYVRRHRWPTVLFISGAVVFQIGRRLGTWDALERGGSHNPFDSSLFWMYSVFGAVFALVTVFFYARQAEAQISFK